jgi:hypothetical protein
MKKTLSTLTLSIAACFAAQAEVRINGFANITGGITSGDESFYDYNDQLSFKDETLFAVQISGDINDKMTATGQLVSRAQNNYEAEFEWAYLAYQINDNATFTAGRFRLPLFAYSNSKDVGYSYHWITAPSNVYEVPFNNMDGIKLDYTDYAGDWEYGFSGSLGTYSGLSNGSISEGRNTYVLSAETTYDEWFKIRAVVGATKSTFDFSTSNDPASAGFAAALASIATAGFPELEDALQIRNNTGKFFGLSLGVDKFDWFVSGEITTTEVEQGLGGLDTSAYVTAGIRRGAWTPSLTYQKSKDEEELKFGGLIDEVRNSSLPDAAKAGLVGLAIGAQLGQADEFAVTSATLRYDWDTNIALKVDLSKFDDIRDGRRDATLLRFGLNYVF